MSTLKEKIFEIQNEYNNLRLKLESYPYNSDFMCKNWENMFKELIKNRSHIIKNRKIPNVNFLSKLKYKFNLI